MIKEVTAEGGWSRVAIGWNKLAQVVAATSLGQVPPREVNLPELRVLRADACPRAHEMRHKQDGFVAFILSYYQNYLDWFTLTAFYDDRM